MLMKDRFPFAWVMQCVFGQACKGIHQGLEVFRGEKAPPNFAIQTSWEAPQLGRSAGGSQTLEA